jgi:hypothetical protein
MTATGAVGAQRVTNISRSTVVRRPHLCCARAIRRAHRRSPRDDGDPDHGERYCTLARGSPALPFAAGSLPNVLCVSCLSALVVVHELR